MGSEKHKQLVRQGVRWLRRTGEPSLISIGNLIGPARCGVVLSELVSWAGEVPDVIGWRDDQSVLLEIKTSRSDYYREKVKSFRETPESGMGNYRFFLTPVGLLVPKNLPDNWGLLELSGRSVEVMRPAIFQPCNEKNEKTLLISALRRCQQLTTGRDV